MTSDIIDLNSLLKSDSNKFLENLKNSYLNILDVGINDNNKQEIKRSFDSLKSLSGIFELHEITEFIIELETLLNKIIDSNLPFLSNDILNDLFIVKEQIDKLFKYYWQDNKISFDQKTIKENNQYLEILNTHLDEYLQKKELQQRYQDKEEEQDKQNSDVSNELKIQNNILIFEPYSLTIENTEERRKEILALVDDFISINLELLNVNEIDTSGIQLIKSIQNYCLKKNIVCNVKSISSLVEKQLEMLGVSL